MKPSPGNELQGNWVACSRTVLESVVGGDDALLGLYMRLLLTAKFKRQFAYGIKIEPGQMVLADREMRSILYPNSARPPVINTIKARLEQLRDAGAIAIEIHEVKGVRIVTVFDNMSRPFDPIAFEGSPDNAESSGTAERAASKIDATFNAESDARIDAESGADSGAIRIMVKNDENDQTDKLSGFPERKPSDLFVAPRPRPAERKIAHVVAASEISELAANLFRTTRYRGDKGGTIWMAAAAQTLGLISEAAVKSAAMLTGEKGGGPGYFRKVLWQKAGLERDELYALFGSIHVSPKCPATCPVQNSNPYSLDSLPDKDSPVERLVSDVNQLPRAPRDDIAPSQISSERRIASCFNKVPTNFERSLHAQSLKRNEILDMVAAESASHPDSR